jgi:hypothetical protein
VTILTHVFIRRFLKPGCSIHFQAVESQS